LFEQLEKIRALSNQAAKKTTEFYEKEVATQLHDLADVVADMLYLIQEHLSCHDCTVVDHDHTILIAQVDKVYPEQLKGGTDGSPQDDRGTST